MQKISYASVVGSLMYAQVCTRSDITYIVRMLGTEVFEQLGHGLLESSQTGYKVFAENKALFTRILAIESVGDHWIF